MLHFYSKELRCDRTSSVVKTECLWIVHEKVNKAVDDDIAWSCGGVI